MAYRVRAVRDLDEYRAAVSAIGHYFGWVPELEDAERFSQLLPLERLHAAFDGAEIVAGAGSIPFELTVPGGPVPCAGVTVVGVLPSHRRRGLLTRMMRAHLADVRERGEPISALWASEETIYGRYGYGLASLQLAIGADRAGVGLRPGLPRREGQVRIVDHDQALRTFPRLYDNVRRSRVGYLSRSRDWWELRKLDDRPESRRGAGPLNHALLELDGRPAGYALYRVAQDSRGGEWRRTLRVQEAIGVDARATRELWRFLLQVDWMDELDARWLPLDHPLLHIVARLNLLRSKVEDGLWLRLVDVGAALSARGYLGDGRITLEVVSDPIFPDNAGTWTIDDGRARRTSRRPDVRLDVEALGAVFLGGFTFSQLARAERLEESRQGGARRADSLFAVDALPWCPEVF
jgi:predicted acetyltransferase